MGNKSKEAMKRAHLTARTKLIDRYQAEEKSGELGSASAMVINGEKLVMANTGDYRAVICRDGEAYQICRKKQRSTTRHWSLKLISGALRVPKVHKIAGDESITKRSKSSELVVGSESIDSETEFVILASNGVWEVMRHQEAVNLISHIEDPQAAAECLATEALIRMSKSQISCLIIRTNEGYRNNNVCACIYIFCVCGEIEKCGKPRVPYNLDSELKVTEKQLKEKRRVVWEVHRPRKRINWRKCVRNDKGKWKSAENVRKHPCVGALNGGSMDHANLRRK
ncbi:Phosphoprotein phosphatase [Handroanthus impetiginosus]|uniref:Phosphoprotein phosphatase n=1 Tax=Handroanthus impetiginosus TaxID=429701 RepID=A0A2G9H9V8_9LAMI|nr:Phosphoprotein phosphatase [Handroanthus impetiginosus]